MIKLRIPSLSLLGFTLSCMSSSAYAGFGYWPIPLCADALKMMKGALLRLEPLSKESDDLSLITVYDRDEMALSTPAPSKWDSVLSLQKNDEILEVAIDFDATTETLQFSVDTEKREKRIFKIARITETFFKEGFSDSVKQIPMEINKIQKRPGTARLIFYVRWFEGKNGFSTGAFEIDLEKALFDS